MSVGKIKARFLEPMECLPVAKLPEGTVWTWEIKLDGWRMELVKTGGRVKLYSRRAKVFNTQFPFVAWELESLPGETVIDGELVAVDANGRPSFNLLQNFGSAQSSLFYYAFDIPIHNGNDLIRTPLSQRREVLRSVVRAGNRVGISESSDRPLPTWCSSSNRIALKASWPSVPTADRDPWNRAADCNGHDRGDR